MTDLHPTHDPVRRSFVNSATPDSDFPIQNLPYGVFSYGDRKHHVGVAIGVMIFDLTVAEREGLLRPGGQRKVFNQGALNRFMALPQKVWSETRAHIAYLLGIDSPLSAEQRDSLLVPQATAELHLPIYVRSFTDFYASKEHASNVGTMFRGADNALMPNWLHVPIGYNGRASTVVVSGTEVRRPLGQLKGPNDDAPHVGPSAKLDIELEMGAIVGTPSEMGRPVTTAEAQEMIFGYVLLNDWSARDIQVWEYQPLGPFLSKAFATSISPWVVTRDALEPFRTATPPRETPLLPYLHEDTPNNYDMNLEVDMAADGHRPTTISRTNFKYMYYSMAQQLAHHALSGCAMETGDLLGSGTISGPTRDGFGSLLELSWNGRDPLDVDGCARTFIEDYDTLTLRGWCENEHYRIGFGECSGRILPAIKDLF